MLALMLDPRFKSMCLVTMFFSRENAIAMVVEYLPMEANKLLMLDNVEEASNIHL